MPAALFQFDLVQKHSGQGDNKLFHEGNPNVVTNSIMSHLIKRMTPTHPKALPPLAARIWSDARHAAPSWRAAGHLPLAMHEILQCSATMSPKTVHAPLQPHAHISLFRSAATKCREFVNNDTNHTPSTLSVRWNLTASV